MITLDPRQKTISQIAFARTVAFILEASNRSKITLHTAKPRNRVQLVMNNTAEELPAAKKNCFVQWRFKSSNGMLPMTSTSLIRKLIFKKMFMKTEPLSYVV